MKELTINEIQAVSGAGIFSSAVAFAGNMVIDAVKLTNDVFNTNTFSSVGRFANSIGLGSLHHALDSIGYAVSKTFASLGAILGGDADRITYHFEEEWGA